VPAGGVILKTMDRLPPDAEPRGRKHAEPHVDRAYRVFADAYDPNFHEFEYMVGVEDGPQAVAAIRELIAGSHPDQAFPVEVRFVAADDAMLSPFAGRASCSISVSGVLGADNEALFADCHRELEPFGGRGHWGKWHAHDAGDLPALYPEYDAFRAVRERLDPDGRFLNPYLRTLL
jgi:FAD/FMN-containing dehydrogenase